MADQKIIRDRSETALMASSPIISPGGVDNEEIVKNWVSTLHIEGRLVFVAICLEFIPFPWAKRSQLLIIRRFAALFLQMVLGFESFLELQTLCPFIFVGDIRG